jgi:hypothetical protein
MILVGKNFKNWSAQWHYTSIDGNNNVRKNLPKVLQAFYVNARFNYEQVS